MNQWQYSDYLEQDKPAQRRARLRLHIHEVADYLSGFQARNGGDGWSYSRFASVADYLKSLKAELVELEQQAGRHRKAAFIPMK